VFEIDSDCFVKNGFYKNGKLHLAIINKSHWSKLEGNKKKPTELATAEMVSSECEFDRGLWTKYSLGFRGIDIGLSIIEISQNNWTVFSRWSLGAGLYENRSKYFVIYDWHIPNASISSDHAIERNTSVSGDIFGTLNLFRNILPGSVW
jgi:hypothetical protein